MTAPELADTYVPAPIRYRHVQPGDVIVGHDGTLLYLTALGPNREAHLAGHPHPFAMDPDAPVTVLIPATEHDAMTLMRDQLGAQLIERRTA